MELHDSSIDSSSIRDQGPFMLVLSRCMNNSRGRKFVAIADAARVRALFTEWSGFIAFYPADSVVYERCDLVQL
jgi:hypothetical protein